MHFVDFLLPAFVPQWPRAERWLYCYPDDKFAKY